MFKLFNGFYFSTDKINNESGVAMNKNFDLFIIDDDPNVIDSMMAMLADYPIKIKTFTDPVEGIKELTKNPPHVVFLDYNMPTMNGKDFIIKMSERYLFQHSSVYLITGIELNPMIIMQLHTLGFSKIVQKPFVEDDLVKLLSDVIGPLEKKHAA